MGTHLILDTNFGEVMLRTASDDMNMSDVYIGDNYDNYIGTINCSIWETETIIEKELEKIL